MEIRMARRGSWGLPLWLVLGLIGWSGASAGTALPGPLVETQWLADNLDR